MEREAIPFRERTGKVVWPEGKRLALAMYVALEEWGEETIAKYQRPPQAGPGAFSGMKLPDLAITTTIQYGFNVGIWRLLEIWEEMDVYPNLLSSALAAERHPDVFEVLVKRGQKVVGHGYDQGRFIAQLSDKEMKEDVRRCVKIFEKIVGHRPKGWGSPGTRQYESLIVTIVEEGFEYHMGLHDDELPYILNVKGKRLVEVPYRIVDTGELNDYSMYSRNDCRTTPEAIDYMKVFFDARYEDAQKRPALMSLGVHPYISGRPDRSKVIREFFKYVKQHSDVWVASFDEVADWWRKKFLS